MNNFSALKLKIASPEEILEWSYGEVTKPETINYRTQKPERDGLFSEAIFGPVKDFECYCGKYKRIRYKGIICDRCGVEVTRSVVRRERMGHIRLASPVAHIWFLRGVPSKIALILDVSLLEVERVIYFASYIVSKVNEELKAEAMKKIENEFRSKIKNAKDEEEALRLKEYKDLEKNNLRNIRKYQILSELDFRDLSLKYGEVFEAGIGSEAVKNLLAEMNLEEVAQQIEIELKTVDNPNLRKKMTRRLKLLCGMIKTNIRPEWMIMDILPVIPPALRPMVQLDGGRFATADLNDLYRRVINRNNRLKHLQELHAPEVITKNEKRMLQEAVDALIDGSMRRSQTMVAASTGQKRALKSLADMLKGKTGRFRQNLLGKRVDYSGRSVIVIGPQLAIDECGLPKHMALELFKPFVVHRLISAGLAHNIKSASRLIEQQVPEVWQALEDAIKDKLVLLNRAPTLHRLSVQAFKPSLIEGKAITIPALPISAFNADFDGDQMAVHLPLTNEAQKEARDLMLASHGILKPSNGEPVAAPSKDIVFGCFYLSQMDDGLLGEGKLFSSEEEALLAYENDFVNLRAKIKVRVNRPLGEEEKSEHGFIETTVGRIIFNQHLPESFPFVNKNLVKSFLQHLESEILDKLGEEATVKFLNSVKDLGFHYATLSGVSFSHFDLHDVPEKKQLLEEADKQIDEGRSLYDQGLLTEYERKSKSIEIWTEVKSRLEKLVKQKFSKNDPVSILVESGTRGSWATINQLAGMRGLFTNPNNELIELPVKGSFKEGLNVLEYFISTHGARKGLVDTALNTAQAGYLTRRLVDVSQDVVVREKDCKDKEGYTMYNADGKEFGEPLGKRIKGRFLLEEIKDQNGEVLAKKGTLVDKHLAEKINGLDLEKVRIRSLLTCKTKDGVCQHCYGYDLSKNKLVNMGEAVGIVTAQAIGEPGTQLTMRTFHTGGVAGGGDITVGLPRVDEIFEARLPSTKAAVSDADGQVVELKDSLRQSTIKVKTANGEERVFTVPLGQVLWVKEGDAVTVGQQLSEGHLDPKELYAITKDINIVARYIIKEVQGVYFATGSGINNKHVELIIRQMFSRVRVIDAGDTDLLPGDVVEKRQVSEQNDLMKKENKREATGEQILLGISRVALSTESFLSAASFQETARVLIDAAIIGKEDKLRGLKENVIIGRLIPAGTGYNVPFEVPETLEAE
ncbi:MAG: DNA-directed RNA polymerase subunit beta' [Candidatus Yanofskybacteria bacterium RIFCSPHIGHO2_02_FULL_43_15c]|uniref:DNA-directed RNA polymerase subunit beta' n=1 Tax=Candidatus Yanofskybacteria bacterium RIFCSPHIGHO2_02_FULL_43_15c TaxID=1802679 RepID=A0A1F8FEP0_9BACT|nr:MAG: DNA-directed RNA polymerase subunit beta' [Candidatus Yanofskybacteria bacterium RIFCSPHIGHO2_02_FULL_43_15c]